MPFSRARRVKLAAITGAVPLILFSVLAFFPEDGEVGLVLFVIGACIAVFLFVCVAITKPIKYDD